MAEKRAFVRRRRLPILSIGRDGLFVIFRLAPMDHTRQALGFVIKPASKMLFGERHGMWRGLRIGPLYLRTYHRHSAPEEKS